jgi:ABC-type glycerol-3-phosphate transport system permease component
MQSSHRKNRPHLGRSHLGRGPGALWLFPTVGLFVSSFRTADQIANRAGGRLFPPSRTGLPRPPIPTSAEQDGWRIRHQGNLFEAGNVTISRRGLGRQSSRDRRLRTGEVPIWAMARR